MEKDLLALQNPRLVGVAGADRHASVLDRIGARLYAELECIRIDAVHILTEEAFHADCYVAGSRWLESAMALVGAPMVSSVAFAAGNKHQSGSRGACREAVAWARKAVMRMRW